MEGNDPETDVDTHITSTPRCKRSLEASWGNRHVVGQEAPYSSQGPQPSQQPSHFQVSVRGGDEEPSPGPMAPDHWALLCHLPDRMYPPGHVRTEELSPAFQHLVLQAKLSTEETQLLQKELGENFPQQKRLLTDPCAGVTLGGPAQTTQRSDFTRKTLVDQQSATYARSQDFSVNCQSHQALVPGADARFRFLQLHVQLCPFGHKVHRVSQLRGSEQLTHRASTCRDVTHTRI